MVKKQSTVKGFTILGAAGIINKVLAVMYVPILTLLIDDYGNGIYNAAYTMYLLVYVITNTGIPIAISKLVSEQVALKNYYDSHRTLKISGAILVSLGFVISVLTAVFSGWLSQAVGWPEARMAILVLSPTIFFTSISSTFRGYFQGRSNMTPTGVSQVLEQSLNSVLTIILAWTMLRYGAHYAASCGIQDTQSIRLTSLKFAAAGGTAASVVGGAGSAWFLIRVYMRNRRSILKEIRESSGRNEYYYSSRQIAKRILKYAIPITLGSVAVYTANLIDLKYTKGRLITAGFSQYEASALYGILTTQYQKMLNIPLAIASALAAAIIPTISAAAAVRDRKLLGRRVNDSFRAIFMITLPSAVGLAILAKPIIGILFPRNVHGWDLMMMGSWVLVLISMVQIQTAVLQGIGKTHIPTINMVLALLVKIIINYNLIAIKSINIKGAVIGSAVSYFIAAMLNHRSIRRYSGISMNRRVIFNRPLVASIVMGMAVALVYAAASFILSRFLSSVTLKYFIGASVAIATGVFVYFVVMLSIKGITSRDIQRVPGGGRIYRYLSRYPLMKRLLGN